MTNVEHFKDLSSNMQEKLLAYINSHFTKQKSINYKHTAYGLKQQFTREAKSAEHVTENCFTEAMISAGFIAKPCKKLGSKVCFNAYVLKRPRSIV